MLLKYFYDPALAHASYLVGCQRTGQALVIDPGRDVDGYIATAQEQGLKIVGAAETHIHADFVSGSRELADRVGATLYLSDEGPADWKYQYISKHQVQLLHDGDVFGVGNVQLKVMHTPGHTPEHISFVLTDRGSGASEPMGIFTGDFVFVGSIGRPDLLETAAGVVGSAEVGARQLFHSINKFLALPDFLQVWPAHGAGSACGKGLGAIPSSTVGYEKLFNPALQIRSEQAFVDYILDDQPETPPYFAVMKRVNKVGPQLIRELPAVSRLNMEQLVEVKGTRLVIDTSPATLYAQKSITQTINIPATQLAQWSGFLVDDGEPVLLISNAEGLSAQLKALRSIGIDNIQGYVDRSELEQSDLAKGAYRSISPTELKELMENHSIELLDVRSAHEFSEEHIEGATHAFLGGLRKSSKTLSPDETFVVQCQGGGRSAIAASLLSRSGLKVLNLAGGLNAWKRANLPVVHPSVDQHVVGA